MSRSTSTNFGAPGTSFPIADATGDAFAKEDVQDLAAAVDAHDHSAGKGLAIQRVGAGVITESMLANDAVTADKLADHASTDASRAVTTNHIRDSAITAPKIATGAVTATKLGTGAALGLAFSRCYAGYTASALTVSNATLTAVPFGAADVFDTDGMHSPSVNNTRITVATAGFYLLYGYVKWTGNTTGQRELYFRFTRSAVTTYLQTALSINTNSSAGVSSQHSMTTALELQAGDYVELVVWQNSTGSLVLLDAGFGVSMYGL